MDFTPVFSASRTRRAAALLACLGTGGALAACGGSDPNVYRPAPRYTGSQQPTPVYSSPSSGATAPSYTAPPPAPTYTSPPPAPRPAPSGGQGGCGAKCG